MKISTKYLIVITLMTIATSGCNKGGSTDPLPVPDATKPTISITKPTPGQAFISGNTILFQATFSDNEKLKSYDFTISKKVIGGLILKVVPTSTPFSYIKSSTSLTGIKSQDISLNDIIIPANTATNIVTPGAYNLKVTCIDGTDNTTSTTLEFTIN